MKNYSQNTISLLGLMRRIINKVPIGICIVQNKIIKLANPEFENILGFSKGELHNKNLNLIYPKLSTSDLLKSISSIPAIPNTNVYIETQLLKKNGVMIDVYAAMAPLQSGKHTTGVILSIIDISQRKQNERVIAEVHDIYRKSIENASGVPYQLDFDNLTYNFIGKNIQDILGIPLKEITYQTIRSKCLTKVVADPNAITLDPDEYERAFLAGNVNNYRMDIQIKTTDGAIKWLSDNAVPLRQRYSHKVIGALGILQDITTRKNMEREREELSFQLRQQKKLESIGFLAAGVAHEINNPLNGMINYAQLIHERVQDDNLRIFAQGIIEEGERIASIVRNLLAFARQDKETHSPTRVEDIINASLSLIKAVIRKNDIHINVSYDDNLPLIKCRSQQIQQVIINLLTNAVAALNQKYPNYDEDKMIIIISRLIEHNNRQYVRISVEDHGIGIDPDILENIFDPFFTTKGRNEGTGLGLSVTYGIIKEHEGIITCESEPGIFSRFNIDLPVIRD